VANSRRSLFVTDAPGNRKTSIARALQGVRWIMAAQSSRFVPLERLADRQ
jgi:hypothetical protein